MGLYVISLYGGQLAAVPAGFISNTMGWPWVLWWCAILNAIGFVVCFFLMEETMYDRQALPTVNPSTIDNTPVIQSDGEESKDGAMKPLDQKATVEERTLATSYPIRTYWQKLAFFTPLNGRRDTYFERVYRPLQMFRFPGIIFGGFIYGCFLNWFSAVNATVSIFFASPPYNWSEAVRISIHEVLELQLLIMFRSLACLISPKYLEHFLLAFAPVNLGIDCVFV